MIGPLRTITIKVVISHLANQVINIGIMMVNIHLTTFQPVCFCYLIGSDMIQQELHIMH